MGGSSKPWRIAAGAIGILGIAISLFMIRTRPPEQGSVTNSSYGTPHLLPGGGREPQAIENEQTRMIHNRFFDLLREKDPTLSADALSTLVLTSRGGDNYGISGVQLANKTDKESLQRLGQDILKSYYLSENYRVVLKAGTNQDRNFFLQEYYGEGERKFPVVDGSIALTATAPEGPVIEAESAIKQVSDLAPLDPKSMVTVDALQERFKKETSDHDVKVEITGNNGTPQPWIYVDSKGNSHWCLKVRVTTGGNPNVRTTAYWLDAQNATHKAFKIDEEH